MRALSSRPVVHRAEDVARKILDTYLEPDKTFVELREMAIDGATDRLQGFSDACRDEVEQMQEFVPVVTAPALSLRGSKVAWHFPDREHRERHRHQKLFGRLLTMLASLQSSKYRPPIPSSCRDVASKTDVAAPSELSSASQVA